MARGLRRVLDFIEDKELLAWIGVIVTVVGVVTSAVRGVTLALVVFLVLFGVAIGGVIVLAVSRRSHSLKCIKCHKEYKLSGTRGETTEQKEHTIWQARRAMDSFVFSIMQNDGDVKKDEISYRNLGKKGRSSGSVPHTLGPQYVTVVQSSQGTGVRIAFPAPIRKREWIELTRATRSHGAFPADEEAVGKNILFPVDKLSFKVEFKGCAIANAAGTIYAGGLPLDGGFTPLTPSQVAAGEIRLEWALTDAKPGERYVVSWTWV